MKKNKLYLDKLIDTTNIEREKNEKVFEITRRIEQELSRFPNFIGVFPFGSRVKGYSDENIMEPHSGLKGSDYDMHVFENWNILEDESVTDTLCEIGTEYRKKGIKIHFLEQPLREKDLFCLFDVADMVGTEYTHVQSFATLCRAGRGEKINEWRNKVKEEISRLPKEKQETLFQLFSDFLVSSDKRSLLKISERIPGLDTDEYVASRRILWAKRVRRIFA